jgi:alkaline phosphatase
MRNAGRHVLILVTTIAITSCGRSTSESTATRPAPAALQTTAQTTGARARNVILFIGDGMGLSTIAAARAFAVGVDGNLAMDQFPHVALSRTADADHITADSASTMTAMMTGVSVSSGVIGLGPAAERGDFNHDGDGPPLPTLLELAKQAGMKVGVVSTARITHATPASCYAHVNDRDSEAEIALQALPSDAHFNRALGTGIDLLVGGGRQFFVPTTVIDEEGEAGSRTDGRDLRVEFKQAGYTYAWNAADFFRIAPNQLPLLALFERSHMEYEHDRPQDTGGEPSLSDLTSRSIELLSAASRDASRGYFLMVEGGRIDHAHHDGNAWRALTDTVAFDQAIARARTEVSERDTLILVTADHSHTFTLGGYPLRPARDLKYRVTSAPPAYLKSPHNNVFDVVWDLNEHGAVVAETDRNGVPYTALGYQNGPGDRDGRRVDPNVDPFPGVSGSPGRGPNDSEYRQEANVAFKAETHAGEDVALFAAGPGAEKVRGTLRNSRIFQIMKDALGL